MKGQAIPIGFFCTYQVEHILSTVSVLYYGSHCLRRENLVEEVFRAQLSQLFHVTSYTLWKALVGKYVNVVATFIWNYMDL